MNSLRSSSDDGTHRELVHFVAPVLRHLCANLDEVNDIQAQDMLLIVPRVRKGARHLIRVMDLLTIVHDNLLARHD